MRTVRLAKAVCLQLRRTARRLRRQQLVDAGLRDEGKADRRAREAPGRQLQLRQPEAGPHVAGCLLFGAATSLQFFLPTVGVEAPSALLIMLPYLLALLPVAGAVGRQTAPACLGQAYQWG